MTNPQNKPKISFKGWADSTECQIKDAEQVQLRSFSTAVHNVLTKVQYKTDL